MSGRFYNTESNHVKTVKSNHNICSDSFYRALLLFKHLNVIRSMWYYALCRITFSFSSHSSFPLIPKVTVVINLCFDIRFLFLKYVLLLSAYCIIVLMFEPFIVLLDEDECSDLVKLSWCEYLQNLMAKLLNFMHLCCWLNFVCIIRTEYLICIPSITVIKN